MTFYERYEKCCKEKGILPKSQYAAESLGCTRAYIISLSKSGKAPSGNIVANASEMLDVSSDYLLGLIDNVRPIIYDYDEYEVEILAKIRNLNNEGKEATYSMLNGLLDNDIYKKCSTIQNKISK